MTFSVQIKKRRLELGLTQKEVAQRCGMAQSTYAQYESGNRNPKYETMQKILDALEVETNFFPDYRQEPETEIRDTRLRRLSLYFNQLNDAGREKALEVLEILAKVPEFQMKNRE